ncbi:MAG TPA: nucleotidyltransferase family protein [Thermoleophilaceae bacterium]|nr:nucleotidyltransferase family protein [Thermoleophilaceae bacterium]
MPCRAEGAGSGIGGLVLAAGAATRFGAQKQLAELDGVPMLEHSLRAMSSAPVGRVVVVLGSAADEIASKVNLHGADPVVCARWEEGQSASLACGLAELADCEAVVVTLGDQPRVSPKAINRVIGGRNGSSAIRATYNGNPGHPVLLERALFEQLRDVSGDKGARNLLLSVPVRDMPCDDLGGGEDVDTPSELDALRAGGPVTGGAAR